MTGQDFWIYPEGVTNQARAFAQWAEFAGAATDWVRDLDIAPDSRYWAYSRGAEAAAAIRLSLIDWFDHLEQVLVGVDGELRSVAADAVGIDLEQVAEMDALDPRTYIGYDSYPGGSGELVDADERIEENFPVWSPPGGGVAYYCDLGSYDHLNDFTATLVPGDLLSPSQWVETVLGWLGARSLADEVLQSYGGRWGDLHRFADTLQGLGQALTDMHGQLDQAKAYLDTLWQGYAATSAQLYLDDLLSAIDEAAGLLSDAGTLFGQYAEGIEESAEIIAGQLHGFVDAVIFAAVAAALGTATIETAVGGVIGYSAAGLALLRAYMLLYEVRGTLDNIQTIVQIVETLADINAPLSMFAVSVPVPLMEEAP